MRPQPYHAEHPQILGLAAQIALYAARGTLSALSRSTKVHSNTAMAPAYDLVVFGASLPRRAKPVTTYRED